MNNLKKFIRDLALPSLPYMGGALLAAALAATLLLCLVYAIPAEKIRPNVAKSSLNLLEEGEVRAWNKTLPGSKTDNFSGSIMLNIAALPRQKSVLYDSLENAWATYRMNSKPADLYMAVSSSAPAPEISGYPRYWHGYLVALKPLLIFFDIAGIRLLNAIFETLLLLAAAFLIKKRLNAKFMLAFLTAVFYLNPVTVGHTLQYAGVYNAMLVSVLAVLCLGQKIPPAVIFLWTGIATSFLDLLSAPLLTLGFPLILWINLQKAPPRAGAPAAVGATISWYIGYAGMWAAKWLAATLVLGKNVLSDGIRSALYRAFGNGYRETGMTDWSAAAAIRNNFKELCTDETVFLPLLLYFLFITVSWFFSRYAFKKDYRAALTLLIALYPFVWYAIVINHSVIHTLMTYRILAISIFAITAAVAASVKAQPSPKTPPQHQK